MGVGVGEGAGLGVGDGAGVVVGGGVALGKPARTTEVGEEVEIVEPFLFVVMTATRRVLPMLPTTTV